MGLDVEAETGEIMGCGLSRVEWMQESSLPLVRKIESEAPIQDSRAVSIARTSIIDVPFYHRYD